MFLFAGVVVFDWIWMLVWGILGVIDVKCLGIWLLGFVSGWIEFICWFIFVILVGPFRLHKYAIISRKIEVSVALCYYRYFYFRDCLVSGLDLICRVCRYDFVTSIVKCLFRWVQSGVVCMKIVPNWFWVLITILFLFFLVKLSFNSVQRKVFIVDLIDIVIFL